MIKTSKVFIPDVVTAVTPVGAVWPGRGVVTVDTPDGEVVSTIFSPGAVVDKVVSSERVTHMSHILN